MKNSIITIASTIALVFCLTSCKKDNSELIQKIESSQVQLKQEDSILSVQRSEITALLYTDTVQAKDTANLVDMIQKNLVDKQTALITRLELIIQKNKELITKLNDDSVNPNEAEKEYTAQLDEIELMKAEINNVKDSYCKMAATNQDALKNISDTAKTK